MRWKEAIIEYLLAAALGYVLGSVPVALVVARRHGVDLLRVGDGNPGAWNALEQLGGRRAWPAFIGDGLKGLVAGLAGYGLGGIAGAYAGVAGAMVGHALPVFARFRGGKSVMTFVGGAFALTPVAALIALAICGVLGRARSFAVGARAGVFSVPVLQLLIDGPERTAATGALMTLIGALFLAARITRSGGPSRRDRGAPRSG